MYREREGGRAPRQAEPRHVHRHHARPCHHSQFKNNYFAEMRSGSKVGSYFRLMDFCITQL